MQVPTFDEIREALKVPDGRDYNNKNNHKFSIEAMVRHQQRNNALLMAQGLRWRRAGNKGKWDHA